jgi:hypothetical protein
MRFRRWPRVSAYEDSSANALPWFVLSRRSAKLPLLAPLIAEQQLSADAEMTRRVAWWPKVQQHDRDRRAHDWRRARARLTPMGTICAGCSSSSGAGTRIRPIPSPCATRCTALTRAGSISERRHGTTLTR